MAAGTLSLGQRRHVRRTRSPRLGGLLLALCLAALVAGTVADPPDPSRPDDINVDGVAEPVGEDSREEPEVKKERTLNEAIDEEPEIAEPGKFTDNRINKGSFKLHELLKRKRARVMTELTALKKQTQAKELNDEEKSLRISSIDMVQKRINSTYNNFVKSTNYLQEIIDLDYNEYESVQKVMSRPIDIQGMQVSVIKENQIQSEWEKISEKLVELNQSQAMKRPNKVEKVLDDVDSKATALQSILDDHMFRKASSDLSASLATVVKLFYESEEEDGPEEVTPESAPSMMSWLVDEDNNQYALSRPSNPTLVPEDVFLLNDLMLVIGACFLAGFLCKALSLPSFIGYVFAGTLLGPAGYNQIVCIVQLGTLGEIGVFLVLFTLGMEFSVQKLKEVFRVAVIGGTATLICTIFAVTVGCLMMGRNLDESLFVAFCIALSSTTVAINNMTSSDSETPYGRGLLGILLMQDVYLGLIMALMPVLGTIQSISALDIVLLLGKLSLAFGIIGIVTLFVTKFCLGRLIAQLHTAEPSIRLLSMVTLCFATLKLTDYIGCSMELGCFIAGLMFTVAQPETDTKHGYHHTNPHVIIESVKDIFLVVFFASVGMRVYPTFLYDNAILLCALTIITVVLKYAVAMLVWVVGLRNPDKVSGHVIAVGLAQVSEFSFVLSGRAIRLHIITRPIYFLLLSVTGLSLLAAPLLWTMALKTKRHLAPASTGKQARPSPLV